MKSGLNALAAACAIGVMVSAGAAFADTFEVAYDNTVLVTTPDGAQLRYFFEPDGAFAMALPDGARVTGTWRFDGDRVCLKTDDQADYACAPYVDDKKLGDTWTQAGITGEDVTVSLVAGR